MLYPKSVVFKLGYIRTAHQIHGRFTCNVSCHFQQQTRSHESRWYQTSCCKLAPGYLATISFDLADGHCVVKTAGHIIATEWPDNGHFYNVTIGEMVIMIRQVHWSWL